MKFTLTNMLICTHGWFTCYYQSKCLFNVMETNRASLERVEFLMKCNSFPLFCDWCHFKKHCHLINMNLALHTIVSQ